MRYLPLVLLLGACTLATAPAPNRAARNRWGGWDVVLDNGGQCSLLAMDAATPEEAIAFCRRALGVTETIG